MEKVIKTKLEKYVPVRKQLKAVKLFQKQVCRDSQSRVINALSTAA